MPFSLRAVEKARLQRDGDRLRKADADEAAGRDRVAVVDQAHRLARGRSCRDGLGWAAADARVFRCMLVSSRPAANSKAGCGDFRGLRALQRGTNAAGARAYRMRLRPRTL